MIGTIRKVLGVNRVKIFLYIIRCHLRDLLHDLLLGLLCEAHVLVLLAPFLTEAVERLAEIFLNLVLAAEVGQHPVRLLGKASLNHVLIDRERVDPGLHQEYLRFENRFQHLAADIPV